jgi:hypothetical protein
MQGWIEVLPERFEKDVLALMENFEEISPLIDRYWICADDLWNEVECQAPPGRLPSPETLAVVCGNGAE